MDIQEILKMYNEDGLTLVEIGEKINSSKSSISRVLAKEGYVFDKVLKQYVHESVNTENNETVNNVSRETLNTGNNETVNMKKSKSLNTVKCTFELPGQLHRELKAKCALNGVKMVDFVRELIEKSMK